MNKYALIVFLCCAAMSGYLHLCTYETFGASIPPLLGYLFVMLVCLGLPGVFIIDIAFARKGHLKVQEPLDKDGLAGKFN